MGNGEKTPAGTIITALVIILVIVWLISDIVFDVGLFSTLFDLF